MKQQIDLEEAIAAHKQKMRDRGYNDEGKFIPDSVPMAPPIGYKKQPSMVEIVRNMVRSERLADEARRAGMETFEESEDFDVGDDGEDLKSGFENDFDPPIDELRRAIEEERAVKAAPPPVNPSELAPVAPPSAPGAEEPPKGGS